MEIIKQLGDLIETRRPALDRFDRYHQGRQAGALGFIAPEIRAQVGNRLAPVIVNWPRLSVGAVAERLNVEGFRLTGADSPDPRLWSWWAAATLDEGSDLAHHDALIGGSAYVSVWAGPDGTPTIRAESARQCYVSYEPGSGRRRAGLKLWVEDGYGRAVVFTRDKVTKWRSTGRVVEYAGAVPAAGWTQVETLDNPLGEVPLVELRNHGRLIGDPESELTDVIPLTDAIAKLASDMMVSAEFHAMPRRWVTGLELPENLAGEVDTSAATSMAPGRTWFFEDPESKVGQFPEASLAGFVAGIELLTQQLASVTAIPAHYLNSLTGQLPSAESIRAAEASLVAKVRRKQRSFGRSWGEVARLAVMVADGVDPGPVATLWADPETRTFAQAADAAAKLHAEGLLPWAAAVERLGYAPDEIQAMRVQRRQEALDGAGVAFDGLLS